MYVPPAMLMCSRASLKSADALSERRDTVAGIPQSLVATFIIKTRNPGLVWSARGQSERK
jgi:hypothetical protein